MPQDIFCHGPVTIVFLYGVIVQYVPIVFIGPFFNAPPQMMVVIPFNSTLSLLPVCLWLCQCLYPRAWWLADIVFCGIITPFFQKPSEAPFPHRDICCPYCTLELDGCSLWSVFTSYCVCGTKVPSLYWRLRFQCESVSKQQAALSPRHTAVTLSSSRSLNPLQSLFCVCFFRVFSVASCLTLQTQTKKNTSYIQTLS